MGKTALPCGQVFFPFTFGSRGNFHKEHIAFDIAPINLPYNAILGFPALAKFMDIMHHAYNIVKLPSSAGTIIVRCDEANAIESLELTSKAIDLTQATPEDEPDPALLLSLWKRPVFSQMHA